MKITLISLDNWGYNSFIVKELQKKNIEVNHIDFYELRYRYPTFLHRIFNFLAKTFLKYNIKKKHLEKQIIEKLQGQEKQDKILIIKGDFLNPDVIDKIKPFTDNLIGFFNDNYIRSPKISKIYDKFDKAYSFEKKDVKRFDIKFITNFIYAERKSDTVSQKYEVFNISSSGKRDAVIINIAKTLKNIGLSYKIIIVDKKGNTSPFIEYKKKPLNLKEVAACIDSSKVLLDVHRENQLGLTFRVFESLGFSKKLITTNEDVKNYDFYNPNNILVIDKKNVSIPVSFFETAYEPVPEQIYSQYLLSSWVDRIFELS